VHVADLCQAHHLALLRLRAGVEWEAFNLGNGQGYSVLEVIRHAETVVGRQIPWRPAPRRAGDPARLVASAERARRELGWRPRYAELDAILEHAWEWHRRHPSGYAGD